MADKLGTEQSAEVMWQPDGPPQVVGDETHASGDYQVGMQDVADVALVLESSGLPGVLALQQQTVGSSKHPQTADFQSQSELLDAAVPDPRSIDGNAAQVTCPQCSSPCTDTEAADQQHQKSGQQAPPSAMVMGDHTAAVTTRQLLAQEGCQNLATALDKPGQSGRSTICQPTKYTKGAGAASPIPLQQRQTHFANVRHSSVTRPLSLSEPETLSLQPEVQQPALVSQQRLLADAATARTPHADPDQVSSQNASLAAQIEQPLVPYQRRSDKRLSQLPGQHARRHQAGTPARDIGDKYRVSPAVSSHTQKQGVYCCHMCMPAVY